MGNMRPGKLLGVASRLVLCAVLGRMQGRLFINAPSSQRTIMSTIPSTSNSQSSFVSIFNASLESYKRRTKKDLALHPLFLSLQTCESPEAVLTVLRDQVPAFDRSRNDGDGLTKWVTPTVNVLHLFSETIGWGVGLVNIKTFRHGEFSALIFIYRHFRRQV